MSRKQIILYWSLWRKACQAKSWCPRDDAFRHKVHLDLLGRTVSSTALTNAEFDVLIHAFRLWADPTDLGAVMFFEDANQGERRRLLYSIRQMMPAAYVRKVAVDMFDRTDLDALTHDQLTQLRNTLSNRRRAQQRKGSTPALPERLRLRRVGHSTVTIVTSSSARTSEFPF